MKTMEKPRRGQLFDLMGILSLLWTLSDEESRAPEEDYSFFEDPANL